MGELPVGAPPEMEPWVGCVGQQLLIMPGRDLVVAMNVGNCGRPIMEQAASQAR